MFKFKASHENPARKRDNEKGFSLLEMMISIVLFLIITGSIFGLMEITRIDRNRASRRSDTLKNARTAIHLIGRDALNAGLSYSLTGGTVPEGFLASRLGIAQDLDNSRDNLSSIISGNDINQNTLLSNNGKTDLISFVYRDMDFNDSKKVTLNGSQSVAGSPGTASVTTIASTVTTDAAKIPPAVNDLYLVETTDGNQVAVMATGVDLANNKIQFATGDPLAINQAYDGSGESGSLLKPCAPPSVIENCSTAVAALKRFNWVTYTVNSEGTLIRTIYGNNRSGTTPADQIQSQPLAYGIQNMQIRYVLEDGTVTDDPAAGPDGVLGTNDDTPLRLNLIRQITVTLSVQSNENDEQMKTPETVTVTATFSTRNLEYDAG